MTRREFVEIYHMKNEIRSGAPIPGVHYKLVSGCPGMYDDLVKRDPSCDMAYFGKCRYQGTCTECWDTPIPEQTNNEIPMPVIGGRFWTFVRVNVSPYADLLVVGNFVITELMKAGSEIKVIGKDKTLDMEYIFFYDPKNKSIRKLPGNRAMEKQYPEINFEIFWDEKSLNMARRGIVTNREYSNQYILLKKG